MFAEQRQRKILERLANHQSVRVSELASSFHVSEASTRRDLQCLEEAGLLRRTHGGAVVSQTSSFEPSLAEKEDRLKDEKAAIAREAVALIQDGETIMLDAGSTTFEIARQLRERRNITIVTNAVNIARELAAANLDVTLTGGSLRPLTFSLVGPIAETALSGLHVDKLFLATNGVDLKHGLTTPNMAEAQTKRAMIESAREVILVADHSKLGRISFCQFCPLTRVHCLITDAGAPSEFLRALEEHRVKVLVAQGPEPEGTQATQ
jgi:DeoR family fructose operon transcriptional repressor